VISWPKPSATTPTCAPLAREGAQILQLTAEKIEDAVDEKRVYESYYEFHLRVDRLQPHQILAITRGEKEGVLKVRVSIPSATGSTPSRLSSSKISSALCRAARGSHPGFRRTAAAAVHRARCAPRKSEKADNHAIQVFATNLRALLRQPPLAGQTVLGIDPGFRTGCKVAVVDPTGKLLDTGTIYPHEPQKKWKEAISPSKR
jgi:protein Tex